MDPVQVALNSVSDEVPAVEGHVVDPDEGYWSLDVGLEFLYEAVADQTVVAARTCRWAGRVLLLLSEETVGNLAGASLTNENNQKK